MFRAIPDFSDGPVIDRTRRAGEVGEDVLIVRPTPVGGHSLDEGDFPTLKLIAPPAYWHGRPLPLIDA
jgi:hypothetical protein